MPYVKGMLRSETHGRVLRQHPGAELRELPRSSPTAYARLLVELWAREGDLVIVEQDVVPPPGAIQQLLRCRRRWCTHAYEGKYHDLEDMLGLARFSAALKHRHPRGMEAALCRGLGSHHWPVWRSCDALLARWLRVQGETPHRHRPDALHLHDYPPDTVTVPMWPRLTPADENPHAETPTREETPAEVSPAGVPSDVSCSVSGASGLDHSEDDRRDDHAREGRGDDRERPEHDPHRQTAVSG